MLSTPHENRPNTAQLCKTTSSRSRVQAQNANPKDQLQVNLHLTSLPTNQSVLDSMIGQSGHKWGTLQQQGSMSFWLAATDENSERVYLPLQQGPSMSNSVGFVRGSFRLSKHPSSKELLPYPFRKLRVVSRALTIHPSGRASAGCLPPNSCSGG